MRLLAASFFAAGGIIVLLATVRASRARGDGTYRFQDYTAWMLIGLVFYAIAIYLRIGAE